MNDRRIRALVTAIAFAPAVGCAAIMNGVSDKLTAKTTTPGARVYVDGFDATGHPLVVPNDRPHIILVRAKGFDDRVIVVEPKVKAVPIVLDVVFTVPTFAIAPLVDLTLGWWTAVDSPEERVALSPAAAHPRPRPTYVVGNVAIESKPRSR